MGKYLLNVENLRSGYGKLEVLHGISFNIKQNEIVSLIGHNGAGKTTALKSIFGLLQVNQGKVSFLNEDITNHPASKNVLRGISFVPQNNNIFFGFTVHENLLLATHIFEGKLSAAEISERIDGVYKTFPILFERKTQIAGKLSGGQKQMLAIGMAMMHRPKLLILDEPSIGLAPVLFQTVLESIEEINREFGTAILLVEQNVKRALDISHRAYVLKLGKIQTSFDTNEFDETNLWAMF